MNRMGHDSMQAAIIYQHATTEADARIAVALEAELTAEEVGLAEADRAAGALPAQPATEDEAAL